MHLILYWDTFCYRVEHVCYLYSMPESQTTSRVFLSKVIGKEGENLNERAKERETSRNLRLAQVDRREDNAIHRINHYPADSYGKPNGAKFKKQNRRHLNKIVIKVKGDLNQAQENQFTFNRFSLKVKTFRIKLNKIALSL